MTTAKVRPNDAVRQEGTEDLDVRWGDVLAPGCFISQFGERRSPMNPLRLGLSVGLSLFVLFQFACGNAGAAGTIVPWGDCEVDQCRVVSPDSGYVAVAAGAYFGLGLRSSGAIEAWGSCEVWQCTVPSPNRDFVAVAAGDSHGLGLKSNGSVVAWGANGYGQCNVPAPRAASRVLLKSV